MVTESSTSLDVQKFFRAGGTQTDPGTVLRQFERELESKGVTIKPRGGASGRRSRTISAQQLEAQSAASARQAETQRLAKIKKEETARQQSRVREQQRQTRIRAGTISGQVTRAETLRQQSLRTDVRRALPSEVARRQSITGPREPFIQERQIGITRSRGREIPIRQFFFVDPTLGTERIATGLETQQLIREGQALQPIQQPKDILGRTEQFISRERGATGPETFLRGAKSTGLGILASGLGTARFVQAITTRPVQTITSIPSAIISLPARAPEFGLLLRTDPSFAAGFAIGEVATFKGISAAPKGIQKVTDIVRTRGLQEIPAATVIAPEFFAGQTFPTIRRGQTAGQLLEEFKPILPGEVRPAGFTAAPRPFAGVTEAGRGTSELPGVFQAPKISPRFLRVGGEGEKAFTLSVFDTFRPTATRITPSGFELVPGVSPAQRGLAPIGQAQRFFETAPKGKSFVPFIKTEKEAIIPFGTGLKQTAERFFFKFEGRRIPIREFEVTGSGGFQPGIRTPKARPSKTPSIGDISKISSRGIGRRGRFSPLDLGVSSRALGSRGISSGVSSLISSTGISSGVRPSRVSRDIISRSSLSSFRPSVSRAPSRASRLSSFRGGLSSFRPSAIADFSLPGPKAPRKISDREKKRKQPKKEKKRRGLRIQIRPSLTGIAFELKGLPKQTEAFGITPFQLRGLPN